MISDQIKSALVEWRQAREVFLIVPPIKSNERFPLDIWIRLGRAEVNLFELAYKI